MTSKLVAATEARLKDIPMRGFISCRREVLELAIVTGLLRDYPWDVIRHPSIQFRANASPDGKYRMLELIDPPLDSRSLPAGVFKVVLQSKGGKRDYKYDSRFNLGLGSGWAWENGGVDGQEVQVWLQPNDILKVERPKGVRLISQAHMLKYDSNKQNERELVKRIITEEYYERKEK